MPWVQPPPAVQPVALVQASPAVQQEAVHSSPEVHPLSPVQLSAPVQPSPAVQSGPEVQSQFSVVGIVPETCASLVEALAGAGMGSSPTRHTRADMPLADRSMMWLKRGDAWVGSGGCATTVWRAATRVMKTNAAKAQQTNAIVRRDGLPLLIWFPLPPIVRRTTDTRSFYTCTHPPASTPQAAPERIPTHNGKTLRGTIWSGDPQGVHLLAI